MKRTDGHRWRRRRVGAPSAAALATLAAALLAGPACGDDGRCEGSACDDAADGPDEATPEDGGVEDGGVEDGGVEDGDAPDDDAGAGEGFDGGICANAEDCTDRNPCNGDEYCTPERTCARRAPPGDGTACSAGAGPGRCRDLACVPYSCGDGWLDAWRGEVCDDGNVEPGDGCEPDCTPTCTSDEACREIPDDLCTLDTCVPLAPPALGRVCRHEPMPDGEVCDFLDTDCDGLIDEGVPRAVLPPGPVRLADSPSPCVHPAIGWNTANYLVAWIEQAGEVGALWARRVRSDGLLMGDAHRVDTAGRAGRPAVLWTPTSWIAAWTDRRRTGGADAYLTLVDTAAVPFGPERILSDGDADVRGRPAIAWTGLGTAAVWADARLGDDLTELWFRSVAADGVPLADPVRMTDTPGRSDEPAVAWTGSSLAVFWVEGAGRPAGEEQIRFQAVDAAGVPTGVPVDVTTGARSPGDLRATAVGSEIGLAWTDRRSGVAAIFFRRLGADGRAIGTEVRITAPGAAAARPGLAHNGLEWVLVWEDASWGVPQIALAWLPPSGEPRAGDARVTDPGTVCSAPVVAAAEGAHGVAWVDDRSGRSEVYFARFGCPP